jgi:hypothetical protein
MLVLLNSVKLLGKRSEADLSTDEAAISPSDIASLFNMLEQMRNIGLCLAGAWTK